MLGILEALAGKCLCLGNCVSDPEQPPPSVDASPRISVDGGIIDEVPFMITIISRTSARVLFQNGPSKTYHGNHYDSSIDFPNGCAMAAGHTIIDRLFSSVDQNEQIMQEIRQRLDAGRSWTRVVRVPAPSHRRPRASPKELKTMDLVGPVPHRTLFMLRAHRSNSSQSCAQKSLEKARSNMLMTDEPLDLEAAIRLSYEDLDSGIVLAEHASARLYPAAAAAVASSIDHSDAEEEGVWHEVTVQPYLHPVTKDQAMMITQSEATKRAHAECALSNLSEVHLNMLVDVFPRHVIEFLGIHGIDAVPASITTLAHKHNGVSILFMDVVGFTPASNKADPQDVMRMLNELFSGFDGCCAKHHVYKVETVGDCYVVASGLMTEDADGYVTFCPNHDPADSAARIVEFARSALAHSRGVMLPGLARTPVTMRIGIHTGPCVTGLIGSKMPKFSIFGDTMNTASRMESTGAPGRIQVSHSVWELVKHLHTWQPTGGVLVKGKGVMLTYILDDADRGREAVVDFQWMSTKRNRSIASLMNMVTSRSKDSSNDTTFTSPL
jgi:class 3 adenylate cyclase